MIPKVIHYCWFGNNPKPEIVNECIESWSKFCPDYEIKEWNENNFDVNMNSYIREAYNDKKWAFVSDFARLWIVKENGGIYLDTDVLLKKNLNELLSYDCWLACDDIRYVATGLGFGAVKGNKIITALCESYYSYTYPAGTCVALDTKILEKILPQWEKSQEDKVYGNTLIMGVQGKYAQYARHLYIATWTDNHQQRLVEIENIKLNNYRSNFFTKYLWRIKQKLRNPKIIYWMDGHPGRLCKFLTFLLYDLLDAGPMYYLKKGIKKIFNR